MTTSEESEIRQSGMEMEMSKLGNSIKIDDQSPQESVDKEENQENNNNKDEEESEEEEDDKEKKPSIFGILLLFRLPKC
jgi:hypothetical protein